MPQITLGTKTLAYSVRHSARARRISLKIDPYKGLQIIVPSSVNIDDFDALLHSKADWILKHVAQVERMVPAMQRQFISGESLPFLGEPLVLEVIPEANSSRTTVSKKRDKLLIRLQIGLSGGQRNIEIRRALLRWYRREANHYIPQRVEELAQRYRFQYAGITIKNQGKRWGSCSSKRNLNFNLRLMMAPPGAVDYVIIHELCHLLELNHSPRFWKLVEQFCPDYKVWIRWFKNNGLNLMV